MQTEKIPDRINNYLSSLISNSLFFKCEKKLTYNATRRILNKLTGYIDCLYEDKMISYNQEEYIYSKIIDLLNYINKNN